MALIFNKRIEKGMEIMRERNRIYLEDYEKEHGDPEDVKEMAPDSVEEYLPEKQEVEFEKGDLAAIIIAAFSVFWPVFLVLGIILVLTIRWMTHT